MEVILEQALIVGLPSVSAALTGLFPLCLCPQVDRHLVQHG